MNNSKLRIFVDCHVFDGEFQGSRTYIQGLYLELVKDNQKHFFLAAYNTDIIKGIFGEKDNITYVRYASLNKVYRLLLDTPLLIKKHRIDFAHFQYRVPPIKCCKYINTIHDVLFEDYPQYFPKLNRIQSFYSFKFSAKLSDIILTVSKYSQERLKAHLGVGSTITPNAVDPVFFEKYDKIAIQQEVQEKYNLLSYIIYIGRWEPRKNHVMALKAFVNLRLYKSHSLLFIGNETFKSKEYEVYYNGLPNDIRLKVISLKKVDFDQMLLLLRGATASVYPSLAEGFGIPPLEALAAGIPTIVSKATAMQDYEFMGDFFFNASNQTDFENSLHKLINLKDNAPFNTIKQMIRDRYTWKRAAMAYNEALNLYQANRNF